MLETLSLPELLFAAAQIVGVEVVKEATKDAYRKLKNKVGGLFGSRAVKAVEKLENPDTQEEGRKELQRYVGDELSPDEATEIQPLIDALLRAIREDVPARQIVYASVRLNVEAGRNVFIRNIQGARKIDAKVKATQDVTIEDLQLDTERGPAK